VDFAGLLREAFERLVEEIVALVLFTAVGGLLCLTIVLIPTVAGGWVRGTLSYLRTGRVPAFDELWSFDDYLPIALLMLLGAVGIGVGYMLFFIPGVIFSVWWMYALFFLLDRDMGVVEAFGASKEAVQHDGFGNHLVIFLILNLVGMLGGALTGIGWLFTTPYSLLLVALVYLDLVGAGSLDLVGAESLAREAR
jgi:uncharacterized membrane protein